MKILRDNGEPVLDAFIESALLNDDDEAVINLLTSARLTRYRLVITKQDMRELKILLHAIKPQESLI